ncbi:MAG: TetR/AcrR family transcriptional regulator [Betaproteobacteria bacterium]|nr:TetR/AcrR family transcriptional regulator [Betaproteobacteria bacterium]
MARPKSANHDLRREEILDVAAHCFAASSYPAASMNDLAKALGTSKARLYHYYDSKQALLFDLLDRYTLLLVDLVAEVQAQAAQTQLSPQQIVHRLVKRFLQTYESSATRHIALLHSTQFLSETQRALVVGRQRQVVGIFGDLLSQAYPARVNTQNKIPLTMMLFGMINWTFTWLRPQGPLSYDAFAQEVIDTLENGFFQAQSKPEEKHV